MVHLDQVFYKNSSAGEAGISNYQLTDHLGNVRAVIARTSTIPSTLRDYYPFGMAMPGRTNIDGEYRYAYQGQEKDSETGKEALCLLFPIAGKSNKKIQSN